MGPERSSWAARDEGHRVRSAGPSGQAMQASSFAAVRTNYPGNANLAVHVLLEEAGWEHEFILVDRSRSAPWLTRILPDAPSPCRCIWACPHPRVRSERGGRSLRARRPLASSASSHAARRAPGIRSRAHMVDLGNAANGGMSKPAWEAGARLRLSPMVVQIGVRACRPPGVSKRDGTTGIPELRRARRCIRSMTTAVPRVPLHR